MRAQGRLDLRPADARLEGADPRHRVDVDHGVHPREVEHDDGPVGAGERFEPADDARPSAKGHDCEVVCRGGSEHPGHLGRIAGIDDDVRSMARIAGAEATDIGIRFATRVDDAGRATAAHVRLPDDGLQGRPSVGGKPGVGQAHVVDGDGRHRRRRPVDP